MRRYVEPVQGANAVRIYAEERSDYNTWSDNATQLTSLWATVTGTDGKLYPDWDKPELLDKPEYKLEYTDTSYTVWLNVCTTTAAE